MMSDDNIENILKSSLWMVLLTILMIWAPVVGPIVAGIVGGKRSRGVKNAIAAIFSMCIDCLYPVSCDIFHCR